MICLSSAFLFAALAAQDTDVHWPSDAWTPARPEAHGIDPERLAALDAQLVERTVYAFLLVRGGDLVHEFYGDGLGPDDAFVLASCTKSITSCLVGIAIDQGRIPGVDEPIATWFPELRAEGVDERKRAIRLQHLLDMTAGFEWEDEVDHGFMTAGEEWVEYVLGRPMAHAPGRRYEYNTGCSYLLAEIVERVSDDGLADFARRHLFDPLGITSVGWPTSPSGVPHGGARIEMTARDAARFGYLFLREGEWAGEEVVSSEWVAESTRRQSTGIFPSGNYGYQWWLLPRLEDHPTFFARGHGAQFVFVVPSLDLVAVFLGWMPNDELRPVRWLREYVLPACEKE